MQNILAEVEKLEQGIAALEAQRETLGSTVVDAMLAPIREKLAALRATAQSTLAVEQRKQVTILFADVSGYAAMAEKLDAEDVHARMNALWEVLDRVLLDQGGTIDKHIGDAVMAIFGAAETHEDDPERAVRAGLEMQQQLRAFSQAHPKDALQMRIGLSTGPVLLGEVGSRHEFTALGDTVNLASRLEQAAPVGGVLISHPTYRQVRGLFDVQAQPPLIIKGKAEAVQTYLVLQAKAHAFRLPARGVEGVETRMIGRDVELQRLQSALRAVIEQREMRSVTVVGEAGVGKSRLLYEFTTWAELLPEYWLIFKGRAYEAAGCQPYALLRDLFAYRFEILENDPLAVAQEKLEAGITRFMATDPEARLKANFIGHILGFDFSASPYLNGILQDTRQIRDRALYYLLQFFTAAGHEEDVQATVVVHEDIHWADDESLDALAYLQQNGKDLPVLLLALTRPSLFERRPEWGQSGERIDLQPLTSHESSQLVDEILKKAKDIPINLRQIVVDRAEGNPFYVEELIKMLIDSGAILPGAEEWQVVPERLSVVPIPSTLTGILQTRLGGLATAELQTLQCAAVVGRVFWDRAVLLLQDRRLSASPTADGLKAGDNFQALQRRELIFNHVPSTFAGSREYIFKHALLRDVTYETVLIRLRRAYHAQAATWLVEQSGDRVDEYAGAIAGHFERGDEHRPAAEWYARAGSVALRAHALEAAIEYCQKALDLAAGHFPAAWQIPVMRRLGEALMHRTRHPDALQTYQEMLELARQVNDVPGQVQAAIGLQLTYVNLGRYEESLAIVEEVEWVARAAPGLATTELLALLYRKGVSLYYMGRYEPALSTASEILQVATQEAVYASQAESYNLMGGIYSSLGQHRLAEEYFRRSLAMVQTQGNRMAEANLLNNLGEILSQQGKFLEGIAFFDEAAHIVRQNGSLQFESWTLTNLSAGLVEVGRFPEAERTIRQALEMTPPEGHFSEQYVILARALLGCRALEGALEAALESFRLSVQDGRSYAQGLAWGTLAQVISALEGPQQLEELATRLGQTGPVSSAACFAQSITVFEAAGLQNDMAQSLWHWSLHERKAGNLERAEELRSQARAIFEHLDLPIWLERISYE